MYKYLILFLFMFSINTSAQESYPKIFSEDLKKLHKLMQGSFNSENQSLSDSSYFNISLHMYPIWQERGLFLYVEQAINRMQEKPYRQRIYQLKQVDDSVYHSLVYKIPDDSLYIGKWSDENLFGKLQLEDLQLLRGCEVVLKKINENHFEGSTGLKSCESTLYGADYAHSEVEIKLQQITSWDRGFDAEGNQIWGALKGGYIFDKIEYKK